MTPREKQAKFRRKVKEIAAWGLMFSISFLMVIDWIVVGYR